MQNLQIFPESVSLSLINVIKTFDLKGSTFKRRSKNVNRVSNTTALKDLDFLEIYLPKCPDVILLFLIL